MRTLASKSLSHFLFKVTFSLELVVVEMMSLSEHNKVQISQLDYPLSVTCGQSILFEYP